MVSFGWEHPLGNSRRGHPGTGYPTTEQGAGAQAHATEVPHRKGDVEEGNH